MRYYIAINGASCALLRIPSREVPDTIPKAEMLIGFNTLAEAQEAQQICLNAAIPLVRRYMEEWRTDTNVVCHVNAKPEAPDSETVWLLK